MRHFIVTITMLDPGRHTAGFNITQDIEGLDPQEWGKASITALLAYASAIAVECCLTAEEALDLAKELLLHGYVQIGPNQHDATH